MASPHSALYRGLPKTVKPMLARLARQPFDSPDHLFELKWDGIRALAFVEGGNLKLLSRNSRDITGGFPELSRLPAQVGVGGAVLDGELVCLDQQGHPSFSLLQERLNRPSDRRMRGDPVHFIAFDLLYVEGSPVMGEPLFERKNRLHGLLNPSEMAQACDFIEGDGLAFFQATCEHGLEGIVAKEKSSIYLPGKRSQYWLKVKRVRESEFVIGGYTFGGARNRKDAFSTLLLGLYDNDKQLTYVGQVSDGIPGPVARDLARDLQRMHVAACPFQALPDVQRFIFWCRPELVCQVEYGEFSDDGKLVYPMFRALRDDKSPAECTISDALGWPRVLADFA
jgi:DNA ligase-1